MLSRLSKISFQLALFKPECGRTFVSVAAGSSVGIKRDILYKDKMAPISMSIDEAAATIKSGDKLFLHSVACVPVAFMRSLAAYAKSKNMSNVYAYHIHIEGEPIFTDPSCYGIFRDISFFVGKNCRKAVDDGAADAVPIFLSEIPYLFKRDLIKLDYAIVQVSPPDSRGFMTLGTSVDCSKAAVQCAKKVIAIVNKTVPRVHGGGSIHMSQIDILCHDDTPIVTHNPPRGRPQDEAIGKLISENLIDDGSTLQMGIGAIPDAVLSSLNHHKDLGIHTEMVSDGMVDLVESGVITNRKKNIYPGKSVSSFALGTQKLYDFINDNQSFAMEDVTFTNEINIIGKNPKVAAINSCIEVDITGQVVSDSIGKRIYSGIGGQLDFIVGASRAEDGLGKPILAMHSTTNKGKSKIVPTLTEGAGVSTTRSHVRYIVTENGIADLFGKSLQQRARALISIAHPDHREQLEKAAFERFKRIPEA